MIVTLLGTGTSFGVPQVGCVCAVCRSDDPRDRRSRCAAYIETASGTRLLIDTPPELRLQLIAAGVDRADAILYTHEHADHIHGIDDVRALTIRSGAAIPMYGSAATLATIATRFPYIVDATMRPLPGTTKPEGVMRPVTADVPFMVGGTEVLPLGVPHGRTAVLAYRVGRFGYVTDAKTVPEAVLAQLRGVEVLVLNALFARPHPTHLSIDEAVAVAQRIGAGRTYFTHLTHELSHAALAAQLPDGIAPGHDGLRIEIAD